MPWQDNSGGKGGPTRGPWGQTPNGPRGGDRRPGGSGNGGRGEPPDLEELLQASRQRLKRAFPKGANGGGRGRKGPELNARTFGLGAVALLGFWVLSGVYQVETNELAVVTTFGKYDAVTTPGLRWHLPAPIQDAQKVVVTEVRETLVPTRRSAGRTGAGEGLMLTGDKNIVDIEMKVQWLVKPDIAAAEGELPNVAKFIFNIDGPDNLVLTVAEASIREIVGRNSLDFVQTQGRTVIQEETRALMQATLDMQNAGIEIQEVNLEKTDPPTTEVNEAFLDVEAAKQDKEQYINTARAYANRVVPEARGQAQQILEQARAYAAAQTATARGQAARFSAILAEYQKAPEVTRQRMYLETVEKVLGDMNKIIVESDAGSGVVPYLPLNEINKRGGQQ